MNSISSMFKSMSSSKESVHNEKVLKAEVKMAIFIAKNNLPLAVADELPSLMKEIDPDSTVIKDMKCGRSKTTSLLKEIGDITRETLVDRLKSGPFSISTDGSNDMEKLKLFPVVVRIVSESGVHSELFSLTVSEGSSTGKKFFDLNDEEFQKYNIPWENCLAIGCDNANVMKGKDNVVIAFCKEKNPNIILSGCPLHLVHLGAEKGAATLPVSFSDLTDIYHYFKRSSLRSHKLAVLQDFCNKEQLKVLKHVPTRWLSIGKCLTRLRHNWEPLKKFFIESILKLLKSRSTYLYLLFLEHTTDLFTSYLTRNQSDAPLASDIANQSSRLLRTIMLRFVQPSAFGGNKPVTEVEYHLSYNIKENKDLVIGEDCRGYIKDREKNGLTLTKIEEFFSNVKAYFKVVCDYLVKKLPMSDQSLSNLAFVDPRNVKTVSESKVRYFGKMFPVLIPSGSSLDTLIEEFLELQVTEFEFKEGERMDMFWLKMKNFQDGIGVMPFKNISHFRLGLLTIPHSSAHCERIFSCVRKIKTEKRATLKEDTFDALLMIKTKKGDMDFSPSTLKRLKSAYSMALTSSKSQ